jgi:hypothetical protein
MENMIEIPAEIRDAAALIYNFFEKKGIRDWKLMNIADRRTVENLEAKVEELDLEIEEILSGQEFELAQKFVKKAAELFELNVEDGDVFENINKIKTQGSYLSDSKSMPK